MNKQVALIPNGMNQGKMYRRQSSDGNANIIQNVASEALGSAIQNKNEKANAWVRRMRFVMAQATQQNFLHSGGTIPIPINPAATQIQTKGSQGGIGTTSGINNGQMLNQVMQQLNSGN